MTRDPRHSAQRPELPEAVVQSVREFVRSRPEGVLDPQLEAVRAAIMLEDVADVTLSEDQIDPVALADETRMANLVLTMTGDA